MDLDDFDLGRLFEEKKMKTEALLENWKPQKRFAAFITENEIKLLTEDQGCEIQRQVLFKITPLIFSTFQPYVMYAIPLIFNVKTKVCSIVGRELK